MSNALYFESAINRPDLVSPTISALLQNWPGTVPVEDIKVAEIDPSYAGGNELCSHYAIPPEQGAVCVVIEAVRGQNRTIAACVALVNYRIDLNGAVRKMLNARRVSLAPREEVLIASQMEYGSVTPIGLPTAWPILIDERVVAAERIIIGAGLVKAKLALPGKALAELASAKVITGLSTPL